MRNKIMKRAAVVLFTVGLVLGAKENIHAEEIDYQNYFDTKTATVYNDEIGLIHVTGDESKELFVSTPVYETVYTTAHLNLRKEPTTKTPKFITLQPNSQLIRVGASKCGWDIIQINGVNYFMWNEYLSIDPLEVPVIEVYEVEKDKPGFYEGSPNRNFNSGVTNSSSRSQSGNSTSLSTNAAKEEIARRESSGSYDAISPTGKYIGRYQLNRSMLNGDYSPENQERVAEAYVAERYGSWEAALEFWDAHGWY